MATAKDYLWLKERFPELAEAYCVTLVRGLAPAALVERLGATYAGRVITGVDELCAWAYEVWDEEDGDRLPVGVAAVGGWTLMVEANGYAGVTEKLIGPASAGTTLVSHFVNVNAVDHFQWYEDGDLRLTFEPLFPFSRSGSDPDGLVDAMRAAGFDLSDGDDREYRQAGEAAFALAEHITGVRLTPESLAAAEYICAMVDRP
jgi:hypothetical protein